MHKLFRYLFGGNLKRKTVSMLFGPRMLRLRNIFSRRFIKPHFWQKKVIFSTFEERTLGANNLEKDRRTFPDERNAISRN